jgi:hypothetical protein
VPRANRNRKQRNDHRERLERLELPNSGKRRLLCHDGSQEHRDVLDARFVGHENLEQIANRMQFSSLKQLSGILAIKNGCLANKGHEFERQAGLA